MTIVPRLKNHALEAQMKKTALFPGGGRWDVTSFGDDQVVKAS